MRIVLIFLLSLTGCVATGRYDRVIEPLEALKICGSQGVKDYLAISGVVKCREGK